MSAAVDFDAAASGEEGNLRSMGSNGLKERTSSKRSQSTVTIRLTLAERAKLEELAAGMTLSTYVRACLFEREEKRRKRRPQTTVADKRAMAEVLALLGQSRIANNLNQLAYQANIGELEMDEREVRQIAEAYAYVGQMRQMLIKGLRSNT